MLGLVIEHYNDVARTLIERPDRYGPLFAVDKRRNEIFWEIWVARFEKAVKLRPAAWQKLLTADHETARVRENELNARMKWMLDLDNPALDWVSISTGLGVPATRATTAEEFHRQLEAALGAKGPHLIECQIAPRKDLAQLEDYIHKNR